MPDSYIDQIFTYRREHLPSQKEVDDLDALMEIIEVLSDYFRGTTEESITLSKGQVVELYDLIEINFDMFVRFLGYSMLLEREIGLECLYEFRD